MLRIRRFARGFLASGLEMTDYFGCVWIHGGYRGVPGGFVYILASASRTLYVGVTSNLERRLWEHRHHVRDGFTKRYNVTKLVYIAEFSSIDDAISWEKVVKKRSRAKKIALIEERNPRWNDLAWNWFDEPIHHS